jgi:hypothetical protein
MNAQQSNAQLIRAAQDAWMLLASTILKTNGIRCSCEPQSRT